MAKNTQPVGTRDVTSGITLLEVLLVAGLAALVIMAIVSLFNPMLKFLHRSPVRQQASREARTCIDTIKRLMSNGRVSTLTISTPGETPTIPHSRVTFEQLDGSQCEISWTMSPPNSVHFIRTPATGGGALYHTIATHVKSFLFTVDLKDPGLIYVTLRTEWPLDSSGAPNSFYTTFIDKQVIQMSSS